jgi:hypothetical protein
VVVPVTLPSARLSDPVQGPTWAGGWHGEKSACAQDGQATD